MTRPDHAGIAAPRDRPDADARLDGWPVLAYEDAAERQAHTRRQAAILP